MASGKEHDTATIYCTPAIMGATFILSPSLNLDPVSTGIIAGVSFLFGGLYLSPDLDIKSNPFYRWKFLRFWWIPYQSILHHRSFWSHTPIIGTLVRLIYLFWPMMFFNINFDPALIDEIVAVIVAIELSALLHLFMDGLLI